MSAVKKINKKFRASLYITLYCIYRSEEEAVPQNVINKDVLNLVNNNNNI